MNATPVISGEYTHIYIPDPDVFPGPDSICFKAGNKYSDWIPNDHTILKGPDNRWHAFGITHPAPPGEYNPQTIHDGEWLLFHSVTDACTFKQSLKQGAWKDEPKVLFPSQRPGETNAIHAPHILQKDGRYYMVYGPRPMRLAISADLYAWEPKGMLFQGPPSSRDPNLLMYNGNFIMTYTVENYLLQRTSQDLVHWSNPTEIFHMNKKGAPESPFMVFYENKFYLFWCIWDDSNGAYDNRTFVYRSDDVFNFNGAPLVAELKAHAPEIIRDEDGDWFISSAEWPYKGVSIAPLKWDGVFRLAEEAHRIETLSTHH